LSAWQTSAATAAPYGYSSATAALPQQLLNVTLFVTMALSSIAFIEPSPHDAMMFVLLAMCIAARVPFDRMLVPLLLLLIVLLIGGLMSLIQVGDEQKPIQYAGTSNYLGIAALMFACLFCDGNLQRLAVLRRAYLLAALIASAAGYIGYFHLLPGSSIFLDLAESGSETFTRVSATFKDPNVFGPFLVFPLLMLMIGLMTRGVRISSIAMMLFLLGGLFFSFSRGAWIHFVISAVACVALLLVLTQDPRERARIFVLTIAAGIGVALVLIAILSISSIHDMFLERAKAIQPYDVGPGGRFWLQRLALGAILDHPNGMGPLEFARVYGLQQHNVYMEAFLVFGWLGGTAYLALVLITLAMGLAALRIPTPWRPYLIAAYATFVGEAVEGLVVDTDHWRHFFLMLGLIWGLAVAGINMYRRDRSRADVSLRLAA
jgi:O-antigen ligase